MASETGVRRIDVAGSATLTSEERAIQMAALRKVQRRVAAIIFFGITIHGVAGCLGAAYVIEGQGRHGDAIAMTLMSGVVAALTYTGVRLILGRPLLSALWIPIALTPTAIGLAWLLTR
ncbi:hypothetical protein CLV56_1267 [Mumia flava]|uniref:Transmembrane protein n=1 Tax=Mumia flava TaxID=1348852 RepID=A0A0B2BUI6_9ACTN|nr:hypothetical protein [Mumia flava]PJJ57047.1 hypothetical protein CLV56_1267 [Mumia flava]